MEYFFASSPGDHSRVGHGLCDRPVRPHRRLGVSDPLDPPEEKQQEAPPVLVTAAPAAPPTATIDSCCVGCQPELPQLGPRAVVSA